MSHPLPPLPILGKTRRNIRLLLTLGILLALLASGLGGFIFVLGSPRPEVTLPFWEAGRAAMLMGLMNLAIYGALFWQVRRLSQRPRRPPGL